MTQSYDYGLWPIVIISSLIFIIFAFSFARPESRRDWRSFGVFSAFVVALFTEMYGFPLTIYLLSGWLGSRYPGLDLFAHSNGHLWQTILGSGDNAHMSIPHVSSNLLIGGGLMLIAVSWRHLYRAQKKGTISSTGPYERIRHPQYVGFVLVLLGFLLQWPTFLTVVMFPFLVWMYARLASAEERGMHTRFGETYAQYAERTPSFWPRIRKTG